METLPFNAASRAWVDRTLVSWAVPAASCSGTLSLPIEHDSRRLVARHMPLRDSFIAIRFGMQQHFLRQCGVRRQNEPPALPCYHGFGLISRHTDSGACDRSLVPVQYDSAHGGGLVAAKPNRYCGLRSLSRVTSWLPFRYAVSRDAQTVSLPSAGREAAG